jgi:hypothetical protein
MQEDSARFYECARALYRSTYTNDSRYKTAFNSRRRHRDEVERLRALIVEAEQDTEAWRSHSDLRKQVKRLKTTIKQMGATIDQGTATPIGGTHVLVMIDALKNHATTCVADDAVETAQVANEVASALCDALRRADAESTRSA